MPNWTALTLAYETWVRDGRPAADERPAPRHRDTLGFSAWAAAQRIVSGTSSTERAAAALVAIRPARRPSAPPVEIWSALSGELERLDDAHCTTNPGDVCMAFGAGWGRSACFDRRDWEGVWPNAFLELLAEVRVVLTAARRALDEVGVELTDRDIRELPAIIATSLLGLCDCGHHVRGGCARSDEHDCCFADHDLRTWRPEQGLHLRPFLDQAVRGLAAPRLLAGAFMQSIVYRILEREGRVLCRPVEFALCPGCGESYEGDRCPTEGCAAPGPALRYPRLHRFIRPESEGGGYREVQRWVCGEETCANLAPVRVARGAVLAPEPCPRCGWAPAPGRRPKRRTVWVRVAHSRGPGVEGTDR
ncbi:MAG: hypothetical protein ACKVWR_09955 [Acidimicrobiales bacterium]